MSYGNICSFLFAFQTSFVDCLVAQTHPEIQTKDEKDVSSAITHS